jgi:hypothetical protein
VVDAARRRGPRRNSFPRMKFWESSAPGDGRALKAKLTRLQIWPEGQQGTVSICRGRGAFECDWAVCGVLVNCLGQGNRAVHHHAAGGHRQRVMLRRSMSACFLCRRHARPDAWVRVPTNLTVGRRPRDAFYRETIKKDEFERQGNAPVYRADAAAAHGYAPGGA